MMGVERVVYKVDPPRPFGSLSRARPPVPPSFALSVVAAVLPAIIDVV